MESRVRLREFVDTGDGSVDLEMAQAGLLVVISFGQSYEVGVGAGTLTRARGGGHPQPPRQCIPGRSGRPDGR